MVHDESELQVPSNGVIRFNNTNLSNGITYDPNTGGVAPAWALNIALPTIVPVSLKNRRLWVEEWAINSSFGLFYKGWFFYYFSSAVLSLIQNGPNSIALKLVLW